MDKHNNFFTPDQVDEQTEARSGSWSHEPGTPEAQMLAELQQIGRLFHDSQEPLLQRTWLRLEERSKRQASSFSKQRREQQMKDTEVRSFSASGKQTKPAASRKITRVVGSVMAAIVVLLLVVAWMVVLPAIHTHKPGTSVGSATKAKASATPTPAQNLAKQVCSFTDPHLADASSVIDYSLDWSKTNNLAFTHHDSVVVNGANCASDSSYHNSMSFPENAIWSPDGQNLLALTITTAGNWTTTALQIVNSNGQLLHSVTLSTGEPMVAPLGSGWMSSSVNLSGGGEQIAGPAWSPDGSEFSLIYATDRSTYYLMTWNAHSLARVLDQPLKLSGAGIANAVWSPDGQYIAAATGKQADGVLLINAHTGALVKHIGTSSAMSSIASLAWSPDSQELATSNIDLVPNGTDNGQQMYATKADNLVHVWQVATGALKSTLVGATALSENVSDPDLQIAWSPDGTKIAAGDQHTVVWDASTGKVVATVSHPDQVVAALAWSPDSQNLATLGISDNQVKATLTIWSL